MRGGERGSEYALIALAFVALLVLGVWNVGGVVVYGDEFHSIKHLGLSYAELFGLYDDRGSGIAFPLLQKLSVDALGAGAVAYRLPAVLGGVLAVALMFPVARRLVGPGPGAVATLALATNAVHVYYTGFGRAYSLVVLVTLLATYALLRAWEVEREVAGRAEPSVRWLALLALAIGLVVFLHLTALGLIVGLGLATALFLAARRAPARAWGLSLGAFLVGAILALALHARAWSSLVEFFRAKAGDGDDHDFAPMDVAAVLFGGTAWAWFGVAATCAGAWIAVRKKSLAGFVLVTAAAVPALVVVLARPIGQPYAYARYLIASLPFLLMLEALAVHALCARLLRSASGALAAATLVVVVGPLTFGPLRIGPGGLSAPRDGAFANCETAILPLAAFDAPWNERPSFYASIRESGEHGRIIEAPDLPPRSAFLYRNHFLAHGKDVTIGTFWTTRGGPRGRPFQRLPGATLDSLDADYLVLHINLELELARYWAFVFGADVPPRQARLMSACSRPGHARVRVPALLRIAQELERTLGAPVYRDRYIVAWDLARADGTDTPLQLPRDVIAREGTLETYEQADRLTDRGIRFARNGALERALATFDQALALASNHPVAHAQRGGALAALGRFEEADAAFTRSLALNPYSPEAHYNYAAVLKSRREYAGARKHFAAAAELDPAFATDAP